ncbi:MAG: phosphoribosylformylglycinamidine synthase subunit PurS [Vicinamibacterales bacterium]
MRARVYVTLKPSVFDPQGRVVADALVSLGYDDVRDVRQGKFFEVELDGLETSEAKSRVAEMADKLLANPVIESYRVEILDPVGHTPVHPRPLTAAQGEGSSRESSSDGLGSVAHPASGPVGSVDHEPSGSTNRGTS